MVERLTRQRTRVILAGIGGISGFVVAELWRFSYNSVAGLIIFSCGLAIIIGVGKLASP